MVHIYCYCFRSTGIWTSDLNYMEKVLAREFGADFELNFFDMDDIQRTESSYPLKLNFHAENEFLLCISQEFQLFKFDTVTCIKTRLVDLEEEIILKGRK